MTEQRRSKAVPGRGAMVPPTSSADARTEAVNGCAEALQLLTAGQLAEAWGVRTKHVYSLARDGDLPHVRIGRYMRFRAGAVEAWLNAQEGRDA